MNKRVMSSNPQVVIMAERRTVAIKTTLMCVSIVTVASSQQVPSGGSPPLAIHPVIGDTLDTKERRLFHFLPHYEGFKWAIFHETATDTVAVTVAHEVD